MLAMAQETKRRSSAPTKAQKAYEHLRKMIVERRFASRNWSMRQLAAELGMSVVPVSEALRRLEQENLVVTKPQSGIRIKRMSQKDFADAMLVRQAIECQAVRMVAQKADKKVLASLDRLARRIGEYTAAGMSGKASYLDYRLHYKLVAATGCDLMVSKFDGIATRCMVITDGQTFWAPSSTNDSDHIRLVQAIASGSPARAEAAIRRHIRAERLQQALWE
ncbi:MAG: GntR family transcriptional regulator [Planctomycetes bacterium]|nr:GntR family transcriptional regulator [Planctomycetota bacterium]